MLIPRVVPRLKWDQKVFWLLRALGVLITFGVFAEVQGGSASAIVVEPSDSWYESLSLG
jgi:hypothetical protein